jgi:hypothetical protein
MMHEELKLELRFEMGFELELEFFAFSFCCRHF